ncbi:MAG: CBS domain-containing protein [Chloroflexi bacterium]|nr:CBS domain-containing protein [Chloroflexota bacterium]
MEVILTHGNAEFDALSSMLGAAKLYPGAYPVLPAAINRNLRDFLALYGDELPFVQLPDLPNEPITRIILVDTQQLPKIKGLLAAIDDIAVEIIDHHPLQVVLAPGVIFHSEQVGANATILVQRLIDRGFEPTPVEATLLLLGIYEDTGRLSYAGTTAMDVRCAAWLLEHGANLSALNEFLNRPLLPEQRALYDELAARTQVIEYNGRQVLVTQARAEGYVEEISTLAHKLNDLYDPDALFMMVQMDHHIQMVARSTTDDIDVGKVLRRFGGGGHGKAAAAVLTRTDLETLRAELLAVLPAYVKRQVTAGEIMNRSVRTVPPEVTIAEAAAQMTRYGYSGLPVVSEDGTLVGVLTRRKVDRAIRHGLGDKLVTKYMRREPVSVPPTAPLSQVQQTMIDREIGGLPVVEEGRLVGVITRSDLLKLWPVADGKRRETSLIDKMNEALPEPLREFLQRAGEVATQEHVSLYLVGGFVRDLLLGVPNLDLDLVVEGDAIAFAKKLAELENGHVRSHRQFGTAKLILPEPRFPMPQDLPPSEDDEYPSLKPKPISIDFVTARTEFYEHPTALPTVESSSIKQDLYRRDFTINTMAICLDKGRYGKLVDFYGGKQDLERRLIRVLHSLSFVEDPTRILRAVRLEQRLGFRIEKRTAELIEDAVEQGLMRRLSGERVRNEVRLILREKEPERIFARLDSQGVLKQIHPSLEWTRWLEERLQRVRDQLPQDWRPLAYLALLTYHFSGEELASFSLNLRLLSASVRLLTEVFRLRHFVGELQAPELTPSALYQLLRPFSLQSIATIYLAEDSELLRSRVDMYRHRLRFVRPRIDGTFLKELGVPAGPVYREVLEALHRAKLDGRVRRFGEEEAFVREQLASRGHRFS